MEMTTSEIVKSFREAKDRRKQMSILADLNTCTVPEIKAELEKGGVNWREFPRAGGKHRVKPKTTTAGIAVTTQESATAIDTAPIERETAFIAEPVGSDGTSTAEQANLELIPKETSDVWVEKLKDATFQSLPETETEYEPEPAESDADTSEAMSNLLDAMRALADSIPSTIVAMAKATKAIAQSEIKSCEETIEKLKGVIAQSDATISKYGKQEEDDEGSN